MKKSSARNKKRKQQNKPFNFASMQVKEAKQTYMYPMPKTRQTFEEALKNERDNAVVNTEQYEKEQASRDKLIVERKVKREALTKVQELLNWFLTDSKL